MTWFVGINGLEWVKEVFDLERNGEGTASGLCELQKPSQLTCLAIVCNKDTNFIDSKVPCKERYEFMPYNIYISMACICEDEWERLWTLAEWRSQIAPSPGFTYWLKVSSTLVIIGSSLLMNWIWKNLVESCTIPQYSLPVSMSRDTNAALLDFRIKWVILFQCGMAGGATSPSVVMLKVLEKLILMNS